MVVIEIPKIESGMYTLEVSVSNLIFIGSKDDGNCIQAKLMIEHVTRDKDNKYKYEVIGIYPPKIKGLTNATHQHNSKIKIEV